MTVEQAVNLKSIDSTNVTLSYAYSTTRLTEITSSSAPFELQKVKSNSSIYIYILVTPTNDTIPSTFQSSIIWYQGKPGTLNIYDSDNTTILATHNIVKGQKIEDDWLQYEIKSTIDGYEVDGWLNDNNVTIEAGERTQGGNIYPNVPNLPTDWLTLDTSTNTYYVSKGTSTLPTKLIIPSTYNGIDVTYIYSASSYSTGVFYNQTSLTSVNLPNTITSIGSYAFYKCTKLTSITIPSSVTNIGDQAFYYCTLLTSGDLSQCTKLTSIENYAFANCTSLTSITIPSSVTNIGDQAFYLCDSLTSIDLSQCTSLTSIGEYVFYSCSSLTSIDLSQCTSLTSIGNHAFPGCRGLTSIDLSKCTSLTSIGNYAFNYCTSLTSVTIPSSVTSIGDSAFIGCSSLISITIPSSVTKIGQYAFYKCSNLTSITFKDTSTWYYGSSSQQTNMSGGTSISVTNASTNATYFTSTYTNKYWYKL